MSVLCIFMHAWFGITIAVVVLYPFALAYTVWHKRKGGRNEDSSDVPDA